MTEKTILQLLRPLYAPRVIVAPELAELQRVLTGQGVPTTSNKNGAFLNEGALRMQGVWMMAVEWACKAAARQLASALEWTKAPPTEQGEYWHWTGDPSQAPFPLSVLWSGTAKKCFVSSRDTHSEQAEWCDSYGGYWLRIPMPSVAGAVALEHAHSVDCFIEGTQVCGM